MSLEQSWNLGKTEKQKTKRTKRKEKIASHLKQIIFLNGDMSHEVGAS